MDDDDADQPADLYLDGGDVQSSADEGDEEDPANPQDARVHSAFTDSERYIELIDFYLRTYH